MADQAEDSGAYTMRFMVPGKMVGSIIGRGGQVIQRMTQETGARINVLPREAVGSTRSERVLEVEGPVYTVCDAFKQIQTVMEAEAETLGFERACEGNCFVPLKLLVQNEVVGHIIGKAGSTINKMKAESGAEISISNAETSKSGNRIVTVSGSADAILTAQAALCDKLNAVMSDPEYSPYLTPAPPTSGSVYGASAFPILGGGRSERNMVMVLENMVGAIIGKAGANAKEITKLSGCKLHIETRDEKAEREANTPAPRRSMSRGDDDDRDPLEERMIIIMGGPEQQFKAQQIIYKRLLEEDQRSGAAKRARRLKVLFMVPNDMLGRVIGKGGAKIKELAGTSGARLRLVRSDNQDQDDLEEDTPLEIFGSFSETQAAQNLLRQIAFEHRIRDGGAK